ncbi:MAG: YigZ family protein [Firmicutes bacterium]|nr:YigZ family protein [Bacillota bacterium]
MNTVIDNINEIVINKSRFICLTYNISNINEVEAKISEAKQKYKDATHYCYAYIIGSLEKASDDGEPSGTAGIPILNVLKKEKVQNVLCIVIRYFGGIKLGSGGLVRAYSKACKEGLIITTLEQGYLVEIKFKYSHIKEIEYLIKDAVIINKNFNNQPIYKFKIKSNKYKQVVEKLNLISDVSIIEDIYI